LTEDEEMSIFGGLPGILKNMITALLTRVCVAAPIVAIVLPIRNP
jgi:hypothetical protein